MSLYSKDELNRFLYTHKKSIELGFNLARGLKEFSVNKSYFSLVENGFNFIKTAYLEDLKYNEDFLTEANGWFRLKSKYDFFPLELFVPIIENFETSSAIKAKYEGAATMKIYNLQITEVALVNGYWGTSLYFKKTKSCSNQNLIDFLVEQKMKDIQCNVVSLHYVQKYKGDVYNFQCEQIRNIDSIESNKYVKRLLAAQKNNLCRSMLFYGPPGTGKTTIINNIINKLNYRTLIINFSEIRDFNMVLFFVDNFKFEALIIDDFDLTEKSASILKFLEDVRSKVKVILGSANSLKAIYPPLIRPDRFDELIKINSLDEVTIKSIVGELPVDFEKIKHWPVAYINELKNRIILNGHNDEIEEDLVELDGRVQKQLENLKI